VPCAVQGFSQEKQRQGSEIEIRSLYFNVISTEDFVKGLSVQPPLDIVTVCEKKKPELGSCVNILIPSSNKKTSTNTDQGTDDPRKSSEKDGHRVGWWILLDLFAFSVGALIGTVLAFWLFTLMFPSNGDVLF